jgi:hypothetical protein
MKLSGQLQTLAALPMGKPTLVPIELEAVWAPNPVRMLQKREQSLAPVLKSNADSSVVQSVA